MSITLNRPKLIFLEVRTLSLTTLCPFFVVFWVWWIVVGHENGMWVAQTGCVTGGRCSVCLGLFWRATDVQWKGREDNHWRLQIDRTGLTHRGDSDVLWSWICGVEGQGGGAGEAGAHTHRSRLPVL